MTIPLPDDRRRAEYVARINRVIDHVDANLGENLRLDELARVAAFSPFHFHRIFHALVGETLGEFVGRLRIEKAAALLLNDPQAPITEIALRCGFGSSAVFARAFRQEYGMSATEWRADLDRKKRKPESKDGKAVGCPARYADLEDPAASPIGRAHSARRREMAKELNAQPRIEDLPEFHVAYLRHIGPYKGDSQLFARLIGNLMRWAGPRGLLGGGSPLMIFYHDHPDLTEEQNLRVSVAIDVPPETLVEGEVGKMTVSAGRYVAVRFELLPDEYQQAWDWVMGQWFPASGYQPDDGLCFERYLNDPATHPEGRSIVDICLPIKPL